MFIRNYFLLFAFIFSTLFGTEPQVLIEEVLHLYFADIPKESIEIQALEGGCEGSVYLIKNGDKSYVFRILNQDNETILQELYAMQEAAKRGVSPPVYYVSPSNEAVLIGFVKGETASIAAAKLPENCIKIARMLRTIHEIPPSVNPRTDFVTWTEAMYRELFQKKDLDAVMDHFKEMGEELAALTDFKVLIHGDLNPRNIFLLEEKSQVIDWSYTRCEDPFYDLSYFSLLQAYGPKEEELLLEAYLEHSPSIEERRRFELTKELNLISLGLNLLCYTFEKNEDVDVSVKPKSLDYYIETFAERGAPLPLQFFYEWGASIFIPFSSKSDCRKITGSSLQAGM